MKVLRVWVINAIVLSLFLACTLPQLDCRNVRKGKYYFYPRNSTKKFLVIRTNSIQKEVEDNTLDTTYWKIKWKSDCSFTLEFSHRINKQTKEEEAFYTAHKVVVEVLHVTKNYYTFRAGIDSISQSTLVDTLWMKR